MPRPIRKAKTKGVKPLAAELPDGAPAEGIATPVAAIAEPPPAEDPQAVRPLAESPESPEGSSAESVALPPRKQRLAPGPDQGSQQKGAPTPNAQKGDGRVVDDKDHIAATSVNIAKLQAMSMSDLNQMARELS